jgi:hypothetical protein
MKKYRFNILLVTLLLLLLIYPFLEHFQLVGLRYLLNVFTTIILISSVHAVSENRRQLILALSIIVPAIVLGWGHELFQFEMSQVGATICRSSPLVSSLTTSWGMPCGGGGSTPKKLPRRCASTCCSAWCGRICMSSLISSFPGRITQNRCPEGTYLYYSFITLSTLGYGDITPANGPAQALAYTEALVGQLYLTILVARLVGLYIANAGSDGTGDT